MRIIIIRHAEPDYENNTLTKKGFEEAKVLGEYLKDLSFDAIYSSPYARAKLTALEIIKHHQDKELVIKDWLHEFEPRITLPGQEKKTITWDFYPRFYTKIKDFYDNDKYMDLPYFKNASVKEEYNNVITNFDNILKKNGYTRNGLLYQVTNENERTLIFVCHFGLMSVLMSHLLNIPYSLIANTFICLPSGVTTFITEEREKGIALFRCNGFSDMSHLNKVGMKVSFSGRFCETFSSNDRH